MSNISKNFLQPACTLIFIAMLAYYAGTQASYKTNQYGLIQQEKCSKRAHEKELDDEEWKRKNGIHEIIPGTAYENHYNEKLNKCFLTETTIGSDRTDKYLLDAFEERNYGTYTSIGAYDAEKLTLPKVTTCYVIGVSGEEKVCQSLQEFNKLVKYYMEDNFSTDNNNQSNWQPVKDKNGNIDFSPLWGGKAK